MSACTWSRRYTRYRALISLPERLAGPCYGLKFPLPNPPPFLCVSVRAMQIGDDLEEIARLRVTTWPSIRMRLLGDLRVAPASSSKPPEQSRHLAENPRQRDDLVTTIATGWSDPHGVELFPTARSRLRHGAGPNLARNSDGESDFGTAEGMRIVVVRHGLADEFALGHQRNEGKSTDALCFHSRLQRVRKFGATNILDTDWLRVLGVARAWRVTINSTPIPIRQPAPTNKPHDARLIEQQDRRALAAQRTVNRIKSRVIHGLSAIGAVQSVRELMQRDLLFAFLRQFTVSSST
jgi:hypothetical protein